MQNSQIILSESESLKQNLNFECPREIFQQQELLEIEYFNFQNQKCLGQVVVNNKIIPEIKEIFKFILEIKFPLQSVIPISYFNFNDILSIEKNNTSGFNYRYILNTNRLSNHAFGLAVDINPEQNIYFKLDQNGKEIFRYPVGGIYDKNVAGTLYAEHPVVLKFKELGFKWGGDWTDYKDYQHFEKVG